MVAASLTGDAALFRKRGSLVDSSERSWTGQINLIHLIAAGKIKASLTRVDISSRIVNIRHPDYLLEGRKRAKTPFSFSKNINIKQ
jgi:hypothetical protein